MLKLLLQRRSKTVAELVINRPERKNAIDFDIIDQFKHHLHLLKNENETNVLIIRGSGDTFCAGGDLQSFHSLMTKEEALKMLKPMSEVIKEIVTLPMITISYLNGTAVGGGAELASATDFRLAKSGGRIGFIQGGLHITTGWGGTSLLKKRVGLTNALSLLCTGKRITMEEALQLGLVQLIISEESQLDDFAEQFFSKEIVGQYKQFLLPETERKDLFLSIDKEVDACASLWESEEHHEAVKSFLVERP